jgi:hypothetical protein
LIIFTRFADQESFEMSAWDDGQAMTRKSDETFRITLKASELENYNKYEFATLFYQIVATDTDNDTIDRTVVFKDASEICPHRIPLKTAFKNYSHDVTLFLRLVSAARMIFTITRCHPTTSGVCDPFRPVQHAFRRDFQAECGRHDEESDDNTHRITPNRKIFPITTPMIMLP